ncbi:MAG: hypothetical protein FJ271_07045 [Planctomycetes bacterium]|nr:hypothetical protein [Planctomycetota bacterium]
MHRNKCRCLMILALAALGLISLGELGPHAAAQQVVGGPRLDVPLGSTVPLQMTNKQFIRGARSENPAIATITIKVDDPRTALVKGEKTGITKITLTDNVGNDEVYEIYVGKSNEQLRQEFLVLVRKAIPTAIVDAVPSGSTTIITGTVANPETIQSVLEIARGVFGEAQPGRGIINGMTVGGVQQVQLDVVVAVVNRTELRNMGFEWFQTSRTQFIGNTFKNQAPGDSFSAAGTLLNVLAPISNLVSTPNAAFAVSDSQSYGFFGFLTALRNENVVKIMAEPRVVTLSGRPAYFVDGGQTPIITSSLGGTNVTYKNFGTVINFLPVVLGNGKIHLEVQPEISNFDNRFAVAVGGVSPIAAPGFNTRAARVAVQMEDGQTLAIGGLIQNEVTGQANKVPCLGDMPYFGYLFRTVSYREEEKEVLILITPHLVDPLDCLQIPKLLPGQETRSPDDFELFLEGILEAPRGQRTICCPGHRPAYVNSPNNGTIPAHGAPALMRPSPFPNAMPMPGAVPLPGGLPVPSGVPGTTPPNPFPGPSDMLPQAPTQRLIQPAGSAGFEESTEILIPQPLPAGPLLAPAE